MALSDVLTALEQHWDDVLTFLDEDGRQKLAALVELAAAAPEDDRRAVAAVLDVIDLLLPVLPIGHPVEQAISAGVRYGDPAVEVRALPSAWATIRLRLSGTSPSDAEAVWQEARRLLLAAPCLSDAEVRARGHDPRQSGLIRLEADDGTLRLPAFQFDDAGAPRPLVLTINRTLAAEDDPWGVADWWLAENAWLAASPADLLDRVDASVLIATARAEVGC